MTTPLLMASLSGEIDIVRHLIDSGADVFWTDDLNQNGLHKASVFDHPDIFEACRLSWFIRGGTNW